MMRFLLILSFLFLSSCDWAHRIQYQISPAPSDLIFTEAIESSALKASLQKNNEEKAIYYCPMGTFLESDHPILAQRIWLCAGRNGNTAIANLQEFNRGSPWNPDDDFNVAKIIILKELEKQFPSQVILVETPEKMIDIIP